MKKLITLFGLLTGLTANAQLSATTNQFIPQENYGINYGFENGKSGHVASSGTFAITSTAANVSRGQFAASMDFSAGSQTLTLASRTIPGGLQGNECIAEAMIKGGDSNVTMQVYTGSDVIASQQLSAQTAFKPVSISFICPSSGSVQVRFLSSADAAVFYVDDVFMGKNYRVGTVSQAKLIGSLKYAGTASCLFGGTSSTYANYSADTDCPTATVTGLVSAPGTKLPAATLSNVEPGTYKFTVSTTMTAAAGECLWRISDGTNNSDDFSAQYSNGGNFTRGGQLTGFITYSAAQGSTTFNLQHKKVSGTGCDLEINSADHDFVMKIEKLPSVSETVYAPNMQAAYAAVTIAKGASGTSTVTSTFPTFTNHNNTNWTARRTNSGVCLDPTNAGDFGCKFAKLPVGKYLIQLMGENGAASTGGCWLRARETVSGAATKPNTTFGIQVTPPPMGVLEITSEVTNANIILDAARDGATNCNVDVTNYDQTLQIIPIEQGIPMPVVLNSVQTNYAGQMRMETAFITNNGSSCVVSEEYGDWIASPTRGGTGNCAIPFNTAFSQNPHCVGSIYQAVGMNLRIQAISTSSVTIETFNSGGANADQNYQLICFGPK